MLKRLYADNFRALVNFEFRPGRLNLLLGDNGSGKTSVFDVLGRIRELVVNGRPVGELFLHQTRCRWDKREMQRFELEIERGGGLYKYALEVQHPGHSSEKARIHTETVSWDGTEIYRFSGDEVHRLHEDRPDAPAFQYRSDLSLLSAIEPKGWQRSPRLVEFKSYMDGLAVIQPNPFAIDDFSLQETEILARDGSDFASLFSFLNSERPKVRTDLESRLTEAIPGFLGFSLQRAGDRKLLLSRFVSMGEELQFRLSEVSEGQRMLAILYAAVLGLLGSGSTICFDEPDNFVSLPEIQPWLQLLRDTVEERGGQAMIISHHPEVMDYLALDSVWQFDRPSGPVRVRPYERETTPDTEALKLSELVARGM